MPVDVPRARQLLDAGAQLIDALPRSVFDAEHLPGAVSWPLEEMRGDPPGDLDRTKATVVYCFDQRCDLSARASHRLEQLGFAEVYDLIGGRTAWTVLGRPTEGAIGDRHRIGRAVASAPAVSLDATIGDVLAVGAEGRPTAVVNDTGVLMGALLPSARQLPSDTLVEPIMVTAPGTVRPDVRIEELAAQLRKDGLDHVYVTAENGVLVGLVMTADLHV